MFAWNHRVKFCSQDCLNEFRRNKPSPSPKTAFQKGHKLCVGRIMPKGKDSPSWKGGKISLNCKICSKQFEVTRARTNAKTCSRECALAFKRLPENRNAMRKVQRDRVEAGLHNLYRGVTALYTLIRKSAQYKLWRQSVFKRDGFTCQSCGLCGGDLQADHIKQFALILIENNVQSLDDAIKCAPLWDITNGRTLCVPCHKLTGTWGIKNFMTITRQLNQTHE